MDDITLARLQLYSDGGYGKLAAKNESFYAIIWTVDTESKIVNGEIVDLTLGEVVIATPEGRDISIDESRLPFELHFDDITQFEGIRTAENNK